MVIHFADVATSTSQTRVPTLCTGLTLVESWPRAFATALTFRREATRLLSSAPSGFTLTPKTASSTWPATGAGQCLSADLDGLYGQYIYILWFLWLQFNDFGWLAPPARFNISHAMSSMSSWKSMVINFEWQKNMNCVYFFRSMFLTLSVAYDGNNKMRIWFAYLAHVWWVLLGQAIACCVLEQTSLFWH